MRATVTVKNTGTRPVTRSCSSTCTTRCRACPSRYAGCAGSSGSRSQPGQSRQVTFTLDRSDFGFYDNHGDFVVEPGQIELYAGDSSQATLTKSFEVRP